ncbi:hypothetical protein Phum_PHUM200900 [Pediculus humanus corporis]|uniref:Uncharacterized protein n=1 Tax=Pediculus humanus subsp. corporis TaxID=121224 RepID=E0VH50_PEDHC|nr:uncharacterized protein Phum_PHUM200900 [Pediculus humanus corporis]EEB12706.1 hypothetical protein Phum_PHUM200900 [Pediculus humanus corporis]
MVYYYCCTKRFGEKEKAVVLARGNKMSLTDRLNFSQEKLFKILSDNLLKSDGKTRNLIDCKENILFAWDSKTKRLFTQNIKYFKDKDAGFYQVRQHLSTRKKVSKTKYDCFKYINTNNAAPLPYYFSSDHELSSKYKRKIVNNLGVGGRGGREHGGICAMRVFHLEKKK